MAHDWGLAMSLGPLGMPVVVALIIVPLWRICQKAGFPGIAALLIFIPAINLLFLYWLAFVDWPSQRGTPTPNR